MMLKTCFGVTMKQYSLFLLMFGFFVLMLLFPRETFAGATNGLLLWFQILLPTLLPFMIVSNLLISTNAVSYISRFLRPFIQKLFCVSENGCYAILVGFICGYPMGAKVIADLLRTGRISKKEGAYLLSFCNNTSLMFIVSFLVMQNFQDESLLFGTLGILLLSPILCSFLFRIYYHVGKEKMPSSLGGGPQIHFHFAAFDHSIMNGFETITKVGGYMILFSILFALGKNLPVRWLLPTLEISNGIPWLINCGLPFHVVYPLVLGVTSFGGFCATAQTYSMTYQAGLPILPYIIQKLITAMVTSLLAILYLCFIP